MSVTLKRQPIPFGKYLLLDRINIGGMAEVWRAKTFGAGGFERLVAVKRILPNIAEDAEFIAMFIDEAKITVQLAHANIAQIYELAHISGSYFIAMEYVSGRDLRAIFDRCRKRNEPAPVPLVAYVMSRCCEGLDYAHRKKDGRGQDLGIVHRDVSPQNVLVSYDGEVKVIDFGIAKAAGKATKTQHGILKGKFGYMSPEQIRGVPLDRRSDIFAIGICIYELLTGERLFVGESDFSVLEKVRRADVLPPSHFNRRITEQLERIVMKALAKDVEDRYQFASDLGDDLNRFLYGSGQSFGRAELAAFMRATFAEEYEKEKLRQQEAADVRAPDAMLVAIEAGAGLSPARPVAVAPPAGPMPPPVPSMPTPAPVRAPAQPPPPPPQAPAPWEPDSAQDGTSVTAEPAPPLSPGRAAATDEVDRPGPLKAGASAVQGGAPLPGAGASPTSRPKLTVAQPASMVQRDEPSVTVLVDQQPAASVAPVPPATRAEEAPKRGAAGRGDEGGRGGAPAHRAESGPGVPAVLAAPPGVDSLEPTTSPGEVLVSLGRFDVDGADPGGTAITELPAAEGSSGSSDDRRRRPTEHATAPLGPPAAAGGTSRPGSRPRSSGPLPRVAAEAPVRSGRGQRTVTELPMVSEPVPEDSAAAPEAAERLGPRRRRRTSWPQVVLAALVLVAAILGATVAFKALQPRGLLRIDVPPELAGKVTVQINAVTLTEPDGSLLRDWPQLREVPAGKITVMLKAEGYEPVVEIVDVKPGNEFTSLTQRLQPRAPPKGSPAEP